MADNDQKNQDQNAQQTQSGNESQPAESPEKKSSRKFVIIGVVVLLAIIAGLFYWHSTYYEDTDDAQVDAALLEQRPRHVVAQHRDRYAVALQFPGGQAYFVATDTFDAF